MAELLDRPLAGYCHHGAVIALTIDATPQHLAAFTATYPRVETIEEGPASLCTTCCVTRHEVNADG